ncbi:hypothetical protein [Acidovorax sp.]|uniref:hypothetical protein n=1 Tax=Acidovorax sp. TaxID=1872122 RepID=UPI00391F8939
MPTKNHSQVRRLAASAALAALALGHASLHAAPRVPTANELFDWAQTALPAVFPGTQPSVTAAGFSFRGPYSSGNYVGVEGSSVYVLGPVTGNQLLRVGALADFACSVHPTSCTSSDAIAKATAFLAAQDALYATSLPASGAQAFANLDACYFHSGVTRGGEIARFDGDAEVRASLSRRVGAKRTDIEVLAERNTTNSDGSARREIDVRYNLTFTDGMVQRGIQETLVQGSSAGTATVAGACAAPQNSQDLRLLGNQRIVGFGVTSISAVYNRFKLADGTAQSPARRFRSEVRYNLTDPSGVATYAILSGPGIATAFKLVSPRLLATAPEFAGKPGNALNPPVDETFKACWSTGAASIAEAATADCTANGAELNATRVQNTDAAALDQAFNALGFTAGGTYTLQVFADDGWKTVNGQAGKTPIATYQARLAALPESAAALAAGSSANYPEVTLSLTTVDIAATLRNKASAALQTTIAKPAKASAPLRLDNTYLFEQGRVSAAAAYPNVRVNPLTYPAVAATSINSTIPAPPQNLAVPTSAELAISYSDLNGRSVRGILSFN